ncbi:MAG: hypothetical protein KKF41_05730 [Actinobacteria bacterium]|nr:hypothetical protein [Actinomycetota bacterium]MBU1943731.1 hypothetical protein [Actinomycetota bacterium]MBU2687065.1 hypothetical protein [Actinomycetota bacterium]
MVTAMVLLFQDVVLILLLHFTGGNAFLSSLLHVKFIAYQVALPILVMAYGTSLILSTHKQKVEALARR